jgi:hypothetical protein
VKKWQDLDEFSLGLVDISHRRYKLRRDFEQTLFRVPGILTIHNYSLCLLGEGTKKFEKILLSTPWCTVVFRGTLPQKWSEGGLLDQTRTYASTVLFQLDKKPNKLQI